MSCAAGFSAGARFPMKWPSTSNLIARMHFRAELTLCLALEVKARHHGGSCAKIRPFLHSPDVP